MGKTWGMKYGIKIYPQYLVLIILVNSLCMPGSTECVDNEMKTCGVDGEWIVVDCPVGTKCSNSNGKIGCKSKKENLKMLIVLIYIAPVEIKLDVQKYHR